MKMNLKNIIKKQGKTCKEVASILGLSKQNFSYKCKKFEEGKILFSKNQLDLISNFIKVDKSIFFE